MALELFIRRFTLGPRIAASRRRFYSSRLDPSEISTFLAERSWSISSLLPPTPAPPPRIAPQTLHHLLRLSALPIPSSKDEEAELLATLEEQLHFVDSVQKVDTTGVEPLVTVRDECGTGMVMGIEDLMNEGKDERESAEWMAGKRLGKFFTVEAAKGEEAEA